MREGWAIKKMGDICSSIIKGPFGSDIKKSLYVPKGDGAYKVYIQINAIKKDECLGDYYISNDYFKEKMHRFEVKPDDYIITCDGTLGKYLRLSNKMEKGIISASLLKITLNDTILPKYFEYLWDGYILQMLIKEVRNTALKHLPSAGKMEMVPIPLPPIQEQKMIVAELDCLTGIIEKKKEQLKELDNLAQSIFYDMFGDPIANEKGWEVKKLGTFCNSELGKMLDVKKNKGIPRPYLCSINVQWGHFELSPLKEMGFEDDELERYAVKKGDLMICEGGDTGRCAIWNEDYTIYYQNALHRVRFDEEVMLPIVCQYIMKAYKDNGEMDKYSKGQTIKHLVKKTLLSIPMITPSLGFQKEFAKKIKAIEQQKELIKRSIAETETLFNSRMDYWFN